MNTHKKKKKPSSLFEHEEKLYTKSKSILTDPANQDNSLLPDFSTLFEGYEKIYKQVKLLVKLSDKQQFGFITELERAFVSFISTLVTAIEAKHYFTAGHTQRVTEYALFVGQTIGLSNDELNVLKYASLLHDIGKIGIPDAVLTKSGLFTDDERVIMSDHPLWTYKIVKSIKLPRSLKDVPHIAACHHEKIDGTGYPYNLKGEKVPYLARIIAVCDVFDALTSSRDYPKYDRGTILSVAPMEMDRVFSILEYSQGKHFDHGIVDNVIRNRSSMEELCNIIQKDKVYTA